MTAAIARASTATATMTSNSVKPLFLRIEAHPAEHIHGDAIRSIDPRVADDHLEGQHIVAGEENRMRAGSAVTARDLSLSDELQLDVVGEFVGAQLPIVLDRQPFALG